MNEFLQSKEWALVVNLIALLPYAARGVEDAVKLYQRTVAALRDGISDEEMTSLLKEREDLEREILAF